MAAIAPATGTVKETVAVTSPVLAGTLGTRWNNIVNWTFDRSFAKVDFRNTFALNLEKKGDVEADSTLKKVAKMFALTLPLLVFAMFASIGSAYKAVTNCCRATKVEAKVETTENAPAAPVANTAPQA